MSDEKRVVDISEDDVMAPGVKYLFCLCMTRDEFDYDRDGQLLGPLLPDGHVGSVIGVVVVCPRCLNSVTIDDDNYDTFEA